MATIINTDIYNITNAVLGLSRQYINESEDTFGISLYGGIIAMESKKIQRAIEVASQMANEAIPNRAQLEKNIIIHAIMNNITTINAIPAKVYALIALNLNELEYNISNNKFIIDCTSPFYIGEFEYHLDYDIEINRVKVVGEQEVYSAKYLINQPNPASDIINPYLNAPAIIQLEEFGTCLMLNVQLLQYHREVIPKKLVTSDAIDNRTIVFEFTDQLAFFMIKLTEADEVSWITPVFEGTGLDVAPGELFCYYLYLDTNTIRIKFTTESVQPSINAQIDIIVYTTQGKSANKPYIDPIITSLSSDTYHYKNLDSYMILQSDAFNGADRRSKEEIQKLLPKEILCKKCITTTTMLTNYFNTLNTDMVKLNVQPKVDNQLERVYYGYLVMKDEEMNVIPTNVITIDIPVNKFSGEEKNRYVLDAGTLFGLNYGDTIASVINESEKDNYDFVYTSLYTSVVTQSPLYLSHYMLLVNETKYLQYEFVNENSIAQFITNNINWKRNFIGHKKEYEMFISTSQSLLTDLGIIYEEETEEDIILINNMKVIAVFYRDNSPYRYIEAELVDYDLSIFTYNWKIILESTDTLDNSNNIKISNMYACLGSKNSVNEQMYGYLSPNTTVYIYTLVKLDKDYGRGDFEIAVPKKYEGWTVTNKYKVIDGVNFMTNYTEITNSKVTIANKNTFRIKGFPVIGLKYATTEERIDYIVKTMNYEKIYIDAALMILENSIGMDFKYYNTYGPSRAFNISTGELLDRVDISLKYRIRLTSASDAYIIDTMKRDIKAIIEDLNGNEELHIPNQITEITNKYRNLLESIIYFEFITINNYGPGMQHLYAAKEYPIDLVPEFLCIGTRINELGEVEPDITIITE